TATAAARRGGGHQPGPAKHQQNKRPHHHHTFPRATGQERAMKLEPVRVEDLAGWADWTAEEQAAVHRLAAVGARIRQLAQLMNRLADSVEALPVALTGQSPARAVRRQVARATAKADG